MVSNANCKKLKEQILKEKEMNPCTKLITAKNVKNNILTLILYHHTSSIVYKN